MKLLLGAALSAAWVSTGWFYGSIGAAGMWSGAFFDLLLFVSFLLFARDPVPLLSRAIALALLFTFVSRFCADYPGWQTIFLGLAGVFWLLALRVPTPLILLRGDAPFPGSIKSMAVLPFLLWPMLVVFFLAPEMPGGWGREGWLGVIFAVLGAASASRIGRVGPQGMLLAMTAMAIWGVGWTLGALAYAGASETGWAFVGGLASLIAEAMLVGALLAEDGPRVSAEALALAEAMDADQEPA